MFASLSIRAKIFVLIGFLLVGILVISTTGIVNVNRLRGSATDLDAKGFRPAEQTLLLHNNLNNVRGDIFRLLLIPEDQDQSCEFLFEDLSRVDTAMQNLDSMTSILPDSVKAKIASTKEAVAAYQSAVWNIMGSAKSGQIDSAKASMNSGEADLARRKVDAESNDLLKLVEGEVTEVKVRTTSIGQKAFEVLAILSIALLLVGTAGSISLARQILEPLKRMMAALDRIGDGDFQETSVALDGSGEIGAMAASLSRARARLRAAMVAVAKTSKESMDSAHAQVEMTHALSDEADANEREAQSAASATNEASTTLSTISGGASISMSSLESVSAAIEEMTASVTEIARSADETRAMTNRALAGARSASTRMNELSAASKEIEKVIEMIVEISEQTKLLALNATIEAARAGEAGRGFAVVAGEVKELAKGTSEATEDIRKRVEAIRSSTSNAVQEISTVTGNMETLGQNISSIAGAAEQQSATTREISRNINEAVQGTRAINRNLESGSNAVSEIARDLRSVLERGRVLRRIAEEARNLSERSSGISKELSAEVEKFLV
jgi:methyl-accepting chemotaxis protein